MVQGGTGGDERGKEAQAQDNADKEKSTAEDETVEDEVQDTSAKKRASKRSIKGGRKSYDVDGDDDEYFKMLERDESNQRGLKSLRSKEEEEAEEARIVREHQARVKGEISFPVA